MNGPPDLDPLLEQLATFEWILWLILAGGVIGFLQSTVFYRLTTRGMLLFLRKLQRAVQTLPKNQAAEWNKQMIRWYRKNYRSKRLRIFSLISSLGMILSAGALLLLIHFRDAI